MLDTVIYRVHGINQQKMDDLTILQNNKQKIIEKQRLLKLAENDEVTTTLSQEISDLENLISKTKNSTYKNNIALIPEHYDLFIAILEHKGKTFSRIENYHRTEQSESNLSQQEFITTKTSTQVNNHYLEQERMRFTDGDYVKDTYRKIYGKYRISSSAPDVTYSINLSGGYIDFNVSIPKYLYMHNLSQFVPQIDSKFYRLKKGNFFDWNIQRHYLYERFIEFTKSFFNDMYSYFQLHGLQPNYHYLEIRRIDLCYNQIFDSKEDSLMYLEHQKKLHKKSNLRYKQIDKEHHTSIAYHTSKHEYFKIYHKGSEYKSVRYGDFQKHLKINKKIAKYYMKIKQSESLKNHHNKITKQKYLFDIFNTYENIIFKKFEYDSKGEPFDIRHSFQKDLEDSQNKEYRLLIQDLFNFLDNVMPIDTKFISSEADKILRYEISISGYSFNNLFKKYLFRKNCKIHQHYKKTYNLVKKLDKRVQSHRYKILPQDRRDYYMMHDFYNRTSNFTLTNKSQILKHQKKGNYDYSKNFDSYSIQKSYWFFGYKTILENHDCFAFTESFLKKLVDKFKEKIDYYQLKEIEPYDDLLNKVKKYNSLVEKKMESYNRINDYKCYTDLNKTVRKTKGNRFVMKATDLLTESQKRKEGLQKINVANVAIIFKLMTGKDKMSFDQIRNHLNLSKHAFYRRKRSLELLGIYENSLNITKKFIVPINFRRYYHLTKSLKYKKLFFFKTQFSTYA